MICIMGLPLCASEAEYKQKIRENLHNTIDSGIYPCIGKYRSGKVRDVHYVGSKVVMIVSDRISAFDYAADRSIPFKGAVLNLLNQWAFDQTKDIVPNASLSFPHPNVIVQRKCDPIKVECIVRGFVWGSLAAGYEKGSREICGVSLPDGLIRYQKLEEPIFTPTHKSEHDEPMTFQEMIAIVGEETANKIKEYSFALYNRGQEIAEEQGMLFIDTKYEFGFDENHQLTLIDEANTPDSSRYCSIEEYGKFDAIEKAMNTGQYKNVSELLNVRPKLKIKEQSKQFLRDLWTEKGFSYGGAGTPPALSDEDVIEISYRYIELYESLTGKTFVFPEGNLEKTLLSSLVNAGLVEEKTIGCIGGGQLLRMMAEAVRENNLPPKEPVRIEIRVGSDSDLSRIKETFQLLEALSLDYEVRILSAHRTPHEMMEAAKSLAQEGFKVCIGSAGGSAHLPGMTASETSLPVVALPVKTTFLDGLDSLLSMIQMPPGIPNGVVGINHSKSAALAAAQIAFLDTPDVMKRICDYRGIAYREHSPRSKVAIVGAANGESDFEKAKELLAHFSIEAVACADLEEIVDSGCSAIYFVCDLQEDGIEECRALAAKSFLPFIVVPFFRGKVSVTPDFFHDILSTEAVLCMGTNRFTNGALYCAQIIGNQDLSVRAKFEAYRSDLSQEVKRKNQKLIRDKVHKFMEENQ